MILVASTTICTFLLNCLLKIDAKLVTRVSLLTVAEFWMMQFTRGETVIFHQDFLFCKQNISCQVCSYKMFIRMSTYVQNRMAMRDCRRKERLHTLWETFPTAAYSAPSRISSQQKKNLQINR